MPILNVKVSGKKSRKMTQQISELLLELTSRILKKEKNVTVITIDFIPEDCWTIGGALLSDLAQSIFYFDIKITDETNTKDEKANYIKEAFSGFQKLLGNLHETSYIAIHNMKAASYGYGGFTQEQRYQHRVK